MRSIIHFSLILTVFQLSVNFSFAQAKRNDLSPSLNFLTCTYFNLTDSVNTYSTVYNNKAAYAAVKTGLTWGTAGFLSGLALAYISTHSKKSCDLGCAITYAVLPSFLGFTGFLGGTTIGYIKNYTYRNQSRKAASLRRPLKQLGFNLNFAWPLGNNYDQEGIVTGLSFRNLCRKRYIPNKIALLYGYSQKTYYYTYSQDEAVSYRDIQSRETLLGVSLIHQNSRRVFSFLYGIETGLIFSKSSKIGYNHVTPYKNLTCPYLDVLAGLNINIFSFLSMDLTYRFEPIGSYDKLKPDRKYSRLSTRNISTIFYFYVR